MPRRLKIRAELVNRTRIFCFGSTGNTPAECHDILYFYARVLAILAQPTAGRGGSLGDILLRWGSSRAKTTL